MYSYKYMSSVKEFTFVGKNSKIATRYKVAGAVMGSLVLVGAVIVTIVSIYLFFKWKTKRRVTNFQMDIFPPYVLTIYKLIQKYGNIFPMQAWKYILST